MVQINAAGRLKIRAVLVADKESFYSAWGEIDELGNFVGEQVLYDNGDIRIRLDGIDVFYHANNDDSGDDNAKTNDAEGDKENKGKGDPNKPPKGPKDDKLGPKAVPPVDRRRKTLDDEKSTPILKRGLTWVRNNCEKMETVVNNKTEEKLGLENVKYLFKLWGFGEVTVIQMIFAATVLTLGSVYAFYNTWKNQALEKKIDILLEQNLALKGRLEELFVTLEQRRIDAQPAFGPSGN